MEACAHLRFQELPVPFQCKCAGDELCNDIEEKLGVGYHDILELRHFEVANGTEEVVESPESILVFLFCNFENELPYAL